MTKHTIWYVNALLMVVMSVTWMITRRPIDFSWPKAIGVLALAGLIIATVRTDGVTAETASTPASQGPRPDPPAGTPSDPAP